MGLETIALASMAIAGGVAAYGSYQQGQAVKERSEYNAKVATINQNTAQQQTDLDLQRVREKYRRIRGGQIASGAASGLFSNGGFGDLLNDANLQEDLDVLSTLYKTKVEITGSDQRRSLALMEGAQGEFDGTMGAVGSLLSTGGKMYGTYPTLVN